MKDGKEFKPYVPAEKAVSEFTITSVVTGVLLAVVFGAANAYLGLRVGMTVSASIPAAVVSMGVLRILLKRKSILESKMCIREQVLMRLLGILTTDNLSHKKQ